MQPRHLNGTQARVDGDAAFLLFGIVVGLGRAFIDAAELVLGPGVVEQVLGGRGLAGVDVGDDAEVADAASGRADLALAMTHPEVRSATEVQRTQSKTDKGQRPRVRETRVSRHLGLC